MHSLDGCAVARNVQPPVAIASLPVKENLSYSSLSIHFLVPKPVSGLMDEHIFQRWSTKSYRLDFPRKGFDDLAHELMSAWTLNTQRAINQCRLAAKPFDQLVTELLGMLCTD